MEKKLKNLSDTIVNYSLNLKKGEKVLITMQTLEPKPLVKNIIRDIYTTGGLPTIKIIDSELSALINEGLKEEYIDKQIEIKEFEVDYYDCFISIRCNTNEYEGKNMDKNVLKILGIKSKKVDDIRINDKKWVLLNYPSILDAHKAKKKYDEFYEFSLDVMSFDYSKLVKEIKPLKDLMEKTNIVRITGKNTDITFSIKNMPIIPCVGERNIPDGEIYTAPIRDSVNGTITYNTASPYQSNVYTNVSLTFENGKIVKATCDQNHEELNRIFDSDEGARYIGEFAIGFNKKILEPIGDILYDEKILGSIHLTPGRAYKDAFNGNESSIHWDMVLIQREEYGGGNIYFDDVLIRENGVFVLKSLKHLNLN